MTDSKRMIQNESPDRSELDDLIRKSIEHFNSLSPEEQAAHRKAQAESWVRGEMAMAAEAKPPRMVDGVLVYDSYGDYCA